MKISNSGAQYDKYVAPSKSYMSLDTQELNYPLVAHILAGNTPLISGAPGIGKSEGIKSVAQALGWGFHKIEVNVIGDKVDLTGTMTVPASTTAGMENLPVRDTQGADTAYIQVTFPHETVAECVRQAQENPNRIIILFLDEINRTTSDVTSAILSAVTDRKLGISFPDNVRLIAAGNESGHVNVLDNASLTRFCLYTAFPSFSSTADYLGGRTSKLTRGDIEMYSLPHSKHIAVVNAENQALRDAGFSFTEDSIPVRSRKAVDFKLRGFSYSVHDKLRDEYAIGSEIEAGFYTNYCPRTVAMANRFLNVITHVTLPGDKFPMVMFMSLEDVVEGVMACVGDNASSAVLLSHVIPWYFEFLRNAEGSAEYEDFVSSSREAVASEFDGIFAGIFELYEHNANRFTSDESQSVVVYFDERFDTLSYEEFSELARKHLSELNVGAVGVSKNAQRFFNA